jgi:hypothetical protein
MKREIVVVMLAMVLFGVSPAWPVNAVFRHDYVVAGGESYDSVTVYEAPDERTTIEFYGLADYLTMHDSSTLNLHKGGKFESFGDGQSTLYDSSTLNVFEGAAIGAGSAANMDIYDSSTLNIYGGMVELLFCAHDSSTINLDDGSLGLLAGVADNSILNVYGGSIDVFLSNISVSPTATVNIYGSAFEYTAHGRWMPPIMDENDGWWVSQLTGYGFDGDPITLWGLPDPDTHDNINLIPEPGTLLLLGLGSAGLLAITGRGRRR